MTCADRLRPAAGERSRGGGACTEAGGAEPVAVEHVREGDIVLLNDGTIAVIDSVRFGSYWLDSGRQEPGWLGRCAVVVVSRRR
jgi:hypothetical protein